MIIIDADNVCEALVQGVEHLQRKGLREQSRAGTVLVSPGPVMTVTHNPCQRVLFSIIRDANPFFHMYEAIWMLAGRNDVKPLTNFVKRFTDFSEPGGDMHGAYGHRWRSAFGYDQLDHVVATLQRDPTSRQCVIQMWDAAPSLGLVGHEMQGAGREGGDDLRGSWKDRPCNTHIYLRIRTEERHLSHISRLEGGNTVEDMKIKLHDGPSWLDLTVCCRSNDAIMGAHGANAVHFSVLQEYLAARIGCEVGTLYQLSNNYHAYVHDIDVLEDKRYRSGPLPAQLDDDRYWKENIVPDAMFTEPGSADFDIRDTIAWYDKSQLEFDGPSVMNPWFQDTFVTAMLAHNHYKIGDWFTAMQYANNIESPDWNIACTEWLMRRKK